jgi:hypothetical protein
MNKNPTSNQCKDTALAIVLIMLIALRVTGNMALIMPAVLVLVMAMTWPIFFKPAAIVWYGFAEILSTVSSKILLTAIFFLIVTPVGLFRKLTGKDAMALKQWRQGRSSALTSREHKFTASDFKQPF